jgi:hypothetical protein
LRESLARWHRKLFSDVCECLAPAGAQEIERPSARFFAIAIAGRPWVFNMTENILKDGIARRQLAVEVALLFLE